MKKWSSSFVQKTVLPYLILLILALFSISLAVSNFFDDFVLEGWKKELTTESQLIANQLAADPLLENINIDQFAQITGDRITLILPDGKVIAESDHSILSMENHLLRPEIQAALRGDIQPNIRLSTTMHQRYIYVAAPITAENKTIGIIRLAKSLDLYDAVIANFRKILILVAIISLVLALLFMLLQSSSRFNPLKKISEEITKKADKFEPIKGSERRDEIGLLVKAHNSQVEKNNLQIRSLENERTKLSAILTNMSDGVILVDSTGIVTLINTAAQKLFSINHPSKGESLVEVVRQHQIVDLWNAARQTKLTQSTTIQTSLDNDNIHVIASLLGPVLPGEILLLFQDFTQIRKLEMVRKDFISNISHELRTPLASLKALTETLQNGALQDPSVSTRFLQQMDEEIDNLVQIVQELLELSKIESGRVPLQKQKTNIEFLITNPVERMSLQAERARIELKSDFPEKPIEIEVDVVRIQNVFINLIHNAIKFTAPGGNILVSAEKDRNSVIFKVSDTGSGISENDLPRIFERFYKSDRSRSTGGTGLGLSISKHIIEAHNGSIWVESQIGKGSTFFISLPIN